MQSQHVPSGSHSVAGMAAAGAAAAGAAAAYGASGHHQQSATYESAASHYTPDPGHSQSYSYPPPQPYASEVNGSSVGAGVAAAAAAGTGVGLAAEYYNASRQANSKSNVPRKRQTDEEIMSIGRQLTDLAKAQNDDDLKYAGKNRPSGLMSGASKAGDYRKNGGSSRGIGSSKIRVDSSGDDSEWESASDDDDYSDESADSEMAYGTVVSSAIRPTAAAAAAAGAAGALGAAALTSSRNQRNSAVDPRLFGPYNSLHGMVTPQPEDHRDRRNAPSSDRFEPKPLRRSATEPLGPMREVYPVPTSDPDRFDYERHDLPHRARPGPLPLQQPVPKSTVSPKVYETERLEDVVKDSKDSRNWGGAAAAGVAAAAVGAALISDRKDDRENERRDRDRDRERRSERSEKRDREREKEKDRDSKSRDEDIRDKERDRKSKRDSVSSKYDDGKSKEKSSKHSSQFSALDGIPLKYRDTYSEVDPSKPSRRRRGDETRSEHGLDDRRSEVARPSRRDSKKYDKRGERIEPTSSGKAVSEATGKDKAQDKSGVDPFKYQVDTFTKVPTLSTTGGSDKHGRPLTPTVVTVDREPAFDDSPPDTPLPDGRLSRKDSFEIEQRVLADSDDKDRSFAKEAAYKAIHGTAPVAVGAMAAAVIAESVRSKGDRKKPTQDPVQEEADRYYRESEVARKIASKEIHSRSRTPERSVIDKYSKRDDDDDIDRPTIVTPPEYKNHHEDKKWAEHNADVRIDNVFSPSEADNFRTSMRDRDSPSRKTRDPSCERDRPLLNLIYPTPSPSRKPTPAPEKEEKQEKRERARDRDARDRSDKDREETPRSDVAPRKRRSKDEEPRSSKSDVGTSSRRRRTKDREDESSKSDVGPTVVVGPNGDVQLVSTPKSVTWGVNETNEFEVVSPEPREDAELGHRERPRLDKSSQWGMVAAAYAGNSSEPANEPDMAGESRSRDVDVGSSGSRRIYSVEDDVGAPPIPGPKPASPSSQQMPGGFADDIEFAATLAAGLEDSGFDPNIVVEDPTYRRRDSPPGSNELNGSGYVIGEVETPQDNAKAAEPADEWAEVPAKLSKKEKKRLEKLKKQQAAEAVEETPPPVEEPVEPAEPAEPPVKLSKKEQRKRDKEAKARELAAEDETQFVAEPEPIDGSAAQDDTWGDAWEETSSKKSKDRKSRDFGDDSSRVSVPVDTYADLTKDTSPDGEWDEPKKSKKKKSKRDSQSFESPSRSSTFDDATSSRDIKPDNEWEEPNKSKKSKRDSEIYDSPTRSNTFDDATSSRDIKPDDEWEEPRKSQKKSKRDSEIYDSPSRAASVISVDSTGKSRKSKRRSGTGDDWDKYGDGPPDRGRDPFEDRDVSSVVSESRGDDKRSSRRSYRYEDDDDAKSVASAPGGGKKKVSEKRSSGGLFSSIFKSSSKDDEKDKNQSFLGNAGTLGAGAGLVGVGVAAASGLSRLQATESLSDEKDKNDSSREIEQWSRDVSGFDPDIVAKPFKPAIDPQYGDLLPLPPSEPGTPVHDPDELPSLPDSRPDTPPEERSALRDRIAHGRRRSAHETPIKSPSNTAIPIQLRLGPRSGPSSPALFKSSPTTEGFAGAVESPGSARRLNRPTSWDNSREIKPLYLLETARYNTLGDAADQGELPALPPSEASSRSSPGPGSEAWESADEYAHGGYDDDVDYSGQRPLRLDTSMPAYVPGEGAGSQETTPRAEVKPVFPEVSASQGQDEFDPEPVESMTKDRSSYLLASAPSSDRSNKTVDNETLEQRLSEINTTPTKRLGVRGALGDIDEGLTSADEHFSDAVEGSDGVSPAPSRDVSTSEAIEKPTVSEASVAEEASEEDFGMLTGKAKQKAKKAAKKKQALGLDLSETAEQPKEISDVRDIPTEPSVEQATEESAKTSAAPSVEPPAEPEDDFQAPKKGKKGKKNKKKSMAWDEDVGDVAPSDDKVDDGSVVPAVAAAAVAGAAVVTMLEDKAESPETNTSKELAEEMPLESTDAAQIPPAPQEEPETWESTGKKGKKKKKKGKAALPWEDEPTSTDKSMPEPETVPEDVAVDTAEIVKPAEITEPLESSGVAEKGLEADTIAENPEAIVAKEAETPAEAPTEPAADDFWSTPVLSKKDKKKKKKKGLQVDDSWADTPEPAIEPNTQVGEESKPSETTTNVDTPIAEPSAKVELVQDAEPEQPDEEFAPVSKKKKKKDKKKKALSSDAWDEPSSAATESADKSTVPVGDSKHADVPIVQSTPVVEEPVEVSTVVTDADNEISAWDQKLIEKDQLPQTQSTPALEDPEKSGDGNRGLEPEVSEPLFSQIQDEPTSSVEPTQTTDTFVSEKGSGETAAEEPADDAWASATTSKKKAKKNKKKQQQAMAWDTPEEPVVKEAPVDSWDAQDQPPVEDSQRPDEVAWESTGPTDASPVEEEPAAEFGWGRPTATSGKFSGKLWDTPTPQRLGGDPDAQDQWGEEHQEEQYDVDPEAQAEGEPGPEDGWDLDDDFFSKPAAAPEPVSDDLGWDKPAEDAKTEQEAEEDEWSALITSKKSKKSKKKQAKLDAEASRSLPAESSDPASNEADQAGKDGPSGDTPSEPVQAQAEETSMAEEWGIGLSKKDKKKLKRQQQQQSTVAAWDEPSASEPMTKTPDPEVAADPEAEFEVPKKGKKNKKKKAAAMSWDDEDPADKPSTSTPDDWDTSAEKPSEELSTEHTTPDTWEDRDITPQPEAAPDDETTESKETVADANDNDFLFPTKLSKKDKKKQKKLAAAAEAIGAREPAEPEAKEDSTNDKKLEIPEAEAAEATETKEDLTDDWQSPENTSGFVTPAESVSGQDPDTNPDDEWGGFSLKKSKKDKKKKKAKDLESEPTQEPETTPQPELESEPRDLGDAGESVASGDTQGEPLEVGDDEWDVGLSKKDKNKKKKNKSISFDEPEPAATTEEGAGDLGQASQPPDNENEKPEDEWSLGLSKKDKKKKKKAKSVTFDLGEAPTTGEAQDEDKNVSEAPGVEASGEPAPIVEMQDDHPTSSQETKAVSSEVEDLQESPAEGGPGESEAEAPTEAASEDVKPVEVVDDAWAPPLSKKDKKKKKKAQAAAALVASETEDTDKPNEESDTIATLESSQPSEEISAPEEIADTSRELEPTIESESQAFEGDQALETQDVAVEDDWGAGLSKKDKKKKKKAAAAAAAAALVDWDTTIDPEATTSVDASAAPADTLEAATEPEVVKEEAEPAETVLTEEPSLGTSGTQGTTEDSWSSGLSKKEKKKKQKQKAKASAFDDWDTPTESAATEPEPLTTVDDTPEPTAEVDPSKEEAETGIVLATKPVVESTESQEAAEDDWSAGRSKKDKKKKQKKAKAAAAFDDWKVPSEPAPAPSEPETPAAVDDAVEPIAEAEPLKEEPEVQATTSQSSDSAMKPAEADEPIEDAWSLGLSKKEKKKQKKAKAAAALDDWSTPSEPAPEASAPEEPASIEPEASAPVDDTRGFVAETEAAKDEAEVGAPQSSEPIVEPIETQGAADEDWSAGLSKKDKKKLKKKAKAAGVDDWEAAAESLTPAEPTVDGPEVSRSFEDMVAAEKSLEPEALGEDTTPKDTGISEPTPEATDVAEKEDDSWTAGTSKKDKKKKKKAKAAAAFDDWETPAETPAEPLTSEPEVAKSLDDSPTFEETSEQPASSKLEPSQEDAATPVTDSIEPPEEPTEVDDSWGLSLSKKDKKKKKKAKVLGFDDQDSPAVERSAEPDTAAQQDIESDPTPAGSETRGIDEPPKTTSAHDSIQEETAVADSENTAPDVEPTAEEDDPWSVGLSKKDNKKKKKAKAAAVASDNLEPAGETAEADTPQPIDDAAPSLEPESTPADAAAEPDAPVTESVELADESWSAGLSKKDKKKKKKAKAAALDEWETPAEPDASKSLDEPPAPEEDAHPATEPGSPKEETEVAAAEPVKSEEQSTDPVDDSWSHGLSKKDKKKKKKAMAAVLDDWVATAEPQQPGDTPQAETTSVAQDATIEPTAEPEVVKDEAMEASGESAEPATEVAADSWDVGLSKKDKKKKKKALTKALDDWEPVAEPESVPETHELRDKVEASTMDPQESQPAIEATATVEEPIEPPVEEEKPEEDWSQGLSKKDKKKKKKDLAKAVDSWEPVTEPSSVPETQEMRDTPGDSTEDVEPVAAGDLPEQAEAITEAIAEPQVEETPEDDWSQGLSKKDKKKRKKALTKALADWEPVAEPDQVPDTMEMRDTATEAEATSGEIQSADEPIKDANEPTASAVSDVQITEEKLEDDWSQGLSKKDKKKKKKQSKTSALTWEPEPESDVQGNQAGAAPGESSTAPVDEDTQMTEPPGQGLPLEESIEAPVDPVESESAGHEKPGEDNVLSEQIGQGSDEPMAMGEVESPAPAPEDDGSWGIGLSKKDKKKKKKAAKAPTMDWDDPVLEPVLEPVAEAEHDATTKPTDTQDNEQQVADTIDPADAVLATEAPHLKEASAPAQEEPDAGWGIGLSKKDKKKKKKAQAMGLDWEPATETAPEPSPEASKPLDHTEVSTLPEPELVTGVEPATSLDEPAPVIENDGDDWSAGLSKKDKKKKKKEKAKAMEMDWEAASVVPQEAGSANVSQGVDQDVALAAPEQDGTPEEPVPIPTDVEQLPTLGGSSEPVAEPTTRTAIDADHDAGDWGFGLSKKDKKKQKKAKALGLSDPFEEATTQTEPIAVAGATEVTDPWNQDQPEGDRLTDAHTGGDDSQAPRDSENFDDTATSRIESFDEDAQGNAQDAAGDDSWQIPVIGKLSKKDKKKKKQAQLATEQLPETPEEPKDVPAEELTRPDGEEPAAPDQDLEQDDPDLPGEPQETDEWLPTKTSKKDKKKAQKLARAAAATALAESTDQFDKQPDEASVPEASPDTAHESANVAESPIPDTQDARDTEYSAGLSDSRAPEAETEPVVEDEWAVPPKKSKKAKKLRAAQLLMSESQAEEPTQDQNRSLDDSDAGNLETSKANPVESLWSKHIEDVPVTEDDHNGSAVPDDLAQTAMDTQDAPSTEEPKTAVGVDQDEWAAGFSTPTSESKKKKKNKDKGLETPTEASEPAQIVGPDPAEEVPVIDRISRELDQKANQDAWADGDALMEDAVKDIHTEDHQHISTTDAADVIMKGAKDKPTAKSTDSEAGRSRSSTMTRAAVAGAAAAATGAAVAAEKSTPGKKGKKGKKNKKSVDKRQPQEDDIFDDPALWESADKKNLQGDVGDDQIDDDFMGGSAKTKWEIAEQENDDFWGGGDDAGDSVELSIEEKGMTIGGDETTTQARGLSQDDIPTPEAENQQEKNEESEGDNIATKKKDVQRSLFTPGAKGTWDAEDHSLAAGANKQAAAWPTPNSDSFSGSDEGVKESGRHGVPLHDDFEESPVIGRGEMPKSRSLAGSVGLLQRGSDIEEPVGGLLREDSQGSVLSTGFGSEFGGSRLSPARSLPAVQEVPEAEAESSREFSHMPDVNRDSGFVTDSPRSSRRRSHLPDEVQKQQRDSGIHTDSWDQPTSTSRAPETPTNKDKSKKALSRSAHSTPVLREPTTAELTPEPEKRSTKGKARQVMPAVVEQRDPPTRSLKSRKSRDYGDLGLDAPSAAASASASGPAPRFGLGSGSGSGLGSDLDAESRSGSPAGGQQRSVSDGSHNVRQAPSPGQPLSAGREPRLRHSMSNTSLARKRTPEPLKFRPDSPGIHNSGVRSTPTPPLRRVDKRVSGDLRALRQQTDTPPVPVANEGRVRSKDKEKDMADVFVSINPRLRNHHHLIDGGCHCFCHNQ